LRKWKWSNYLEFSSGKGYLPAVKLPGRAIGVAGLMTDARDKEMKARILQDRRHYADVT